MSVAITAIEKQGPVIICHTDDSKGRAYKLDFQRAKVYSFTGKPLKSTSTIVNKIPSDLARNNSLYAAIRAFSNVSYCQSTPYYAIVESLLSYPDLIASQIDMGMVRHIFNEYDKKLPKGYVAWCRKNGKNFCYNSLEDFMEDQQLQKWPQSLVDSVKKFSDGAEFNLAKATNYDKDLCFSLMHIINNSLKRYEISNLLHCVQNIILTLQRNPWLRPYLDDTKNAKTALQILVDTINKERNDRILANEAKIAALNGVVIGGLAMKIPSDISDFTNEGEQQHNCVGYYYHDSIANGSTLIYFLRRIENPDVSYVTCRFDMHEKQTVEHRTQYNRWFENDALFEEIDKMIIDHLGL